MRKIAVALALAATCGTACPEQLTAGRLYEACNSSRDVEQTACRFYVLGVVQGAGLIDGSTVGEDGRLALKQRTRLCLPADLPQSQMVEVFRGVMRTLLESRADEAEAPAESIVLAAMHTQFPCP